ncbi:MAG: hypothetical protein K1X29_10800 [Bdellovibrionales bacterium]|nr:hypothetical protein [Bdellovibrionales bacterium]
MDNGKILEKNNFLTEERKDLEQRVELSTDDELSRNEIHQSLHFHFKKITSIQWQEQNKANFLNCNLCGTDLNFISKTNFASLQVEELAYCPCCHIRVKAETHGLQ